MLKKPDKLLRRWDAIARRLDLSQPIMGAEVGVWQGKMSEQLFMCIPDLYLYMVDRWCETPKGDSYFHGSIKIARMDQRKFDEAYRNTLAKVQRFKGKYTVLKMDSLNAAKRVRDGSLDFCFIDADHSYAGTLSDIRAWYPKVKSGGWMCGHDIDHPDQGQVRKAVDEAFGVGAVTVDINRTWFYRI